MLRSAVQLASHVQVPKQHVPLIKFLGKRALLQKHDASGDKTTKSDSHQGPTVDKFGTVLCVLNNESELPKKYLRTPPSSHEAELIELGGAY